MAGFPKRVRLLRSQDFRRVYGEGSRYSGPYFSAFYARQAEACGPRIGFTLRRAVGNAVVRNRIKRRLREVVRLRLGQLNPHWELVINPRRQAIDAPYQELEREVERLFQRCSAS